ncbi:MAG: hypothetical protein NWE92_10730 [Candidatus Bathyarchaeota archaeon]|nr:hypothetical protein [Candidatus Bathyarchaeota archaeon]
MNVEEKTQFIMAIRNLTFTKEEKHPNYTDTTAKDSSNKKILLRTIEPQGRTGFTGVDDVKSMSRLMENEDYEVGILISKRFTTAALEEISNKNIQLISDDYMPHFETGTLYQTIINCVNNQCKVNCGKIPQKKSDCEDKIENKPCKVKALSDNSLFHFEQGWVGLMQNDLKKLLALKAAQ